MMVCSIEIVAHGYSLKHYKKTTEETWAICMASEVLVEKNMDCDMFWFMDDLRRLSKLSHRWETILRGLAHGHTPLMTSKNYPEFMGSLEFPLQKVIKWAEDNGAPNPYWFNHTPAYAVAYAAMLNIEEIHFHGLDYKQREGTQYEPELECIIHWLSFVAGLGIKIWINPYSFLANRNAWLFEPDKELFYGYETQPIIKDMWGEDAVKILDTDKSKA